LRLSRPFTARFGKTGRANKRSRICELTYFHCMSCKLPRLVCQYGATVEEPKYERYWTGPNRIEIVLGNPALRVGFTMIFGGAKRITPAIDKRHPIREKAQC